MTVYRNPSLVELWRRPIHALAFGFGAGLSPKGPGTVGSAVAIPLYVLLSPVSPAIYLVAVVALLLLGVWATGQCERDLAVHDHPGIVLDEIVGQLIAFFLVPVEWPWLLAGFVLFRLFDIWKPGPIRILNNRLRGGWGIMLDDVAAGAVACLVLHGIRYGYGL